MVTKLAIVLGLVFSFSLARASDTQTQTDALVALKKKCSESLADAWKKCGQKEKTSEGYTLRSCSDLGADKAKIISMFDGRSDDLNFGQVCMVSIRSSDLGYVFQQTLENQLGVKIIDSPTELISRSQPLMTVVGKDGTTAYQFATDLKIIWKVKSADGSYVVVSESVVQAIINGQQVAVTPIMPDHNTDDPPKF
jgi:hypothetical protein